MTNCRIFSHTRKLKDMLTALFLWEAADMQEIRRGEMQFSQSGARCQSTPHKGSGPQITTYCTDGFTVNCVVAMMMNKSVKRKISQKYSG